MNDPEVDFYDGLTGWQWSYPLSRNGDQVVANASDVTTRWSWDDSGFHNVAVGNKTAIQLCEALGNGWKLPKREEIVSILNNVSTKFLADNPGTNRWSATTYSGHSEHAHIVTLNSNSVSYDGKSSQHLVSCVR